MGKILYIYFEIRAADLYRCKQKGAALELLAVPKFRILFCALTKIRDNSHLFYSVDHDSRILAFMVAGIARSRASLANARRGPQILNFILTKRPY